MRQSSFALLVAITTLVGAQAHAGTTSLAAPLKINGREIQLAKYAKAYVGSDNITVEVAPFTYKDTKKKGGIIIIRGIESDMEGKAVVNDFTEDSYGWEYARDEDGKHKYSLRMQKLPKEDRIQLYYPGNIQERFVVPSDGAAQQLNTKTIFDEYVKQQS